MEKDEFLWVEKYRPKKIDDVILSEDLKKMFREFVKNKNIPNLILSGSSGVGKTTVAKAMLEEIGCDYLVINGSLEGRTIDVLRNEIASFASSISMTGGRKYVIIDEADYLNQNTVQPAFRNFMEAMASNCGFIFTCNYLGRIISPLQSRCSIIDFSIDKERKIKLMVDMAKRVQSILRQENIQFDQNVILHVIKQYFPDLRRILNELQSYSSISGNIDNGLLSKGKIANFDDIVLFIKNKNFNEIRKWAADNSDLFTGSDFSKFYEFVSSKMEKESIPNFVLILAEYQYKASMIENVAIKQEINVSACLVQVMLECVFK